MKKNNALKDWLGLIPEIQALFDQLNDALFIVDDNTRIIISNKSVVKFTGFDQTYFIGRSITDFLAGFADAYKNMLQKGDLQDHPVIQTEIYANNNRIIPVEVTLINLPRLVHRITCVIVRDVSEIKIAEILQKTSITLSASLNQSEVFDLLLSELRKLIPYDGANFMLVRDQTAFVTRTNGYDAFGTDFEESINSLYFDLENHENLHRLWKDQKPLKIKDTHARPGWLMYETSLPYHSWMGAPIIIEGIVEAILSIDKIEPGYFTKSHLAALENFAALAASAIKNARLFEEGNRRIQQLDGLQATLTAVNSRLDLNDLLHEIVSRAVDLLDSTSGELALFEPEIGKLRVIVSNNEKENNLGQLIDPGKGILGIVAATRSPYKVHPLDENSELIESLRLLGSQSSMAVPLLAGKDLLGVLGVANQKNKRFFDEMDINLLNSFAQQATIAIKNSHLFEDANRRAEEAETLRKAAKVVTSTLDLSQTINLILEQLSVLIPHDNSLVLMQKKDYLEVVGGCGIKNLDLLYKQRILLKDNSPAADVYREKKLLVIEDIEKNYPEFAARVQKMIGLGSWLGAPLIIRDRVIGILALNSTKDHGFAENQLRLVQPFADQVAIALENARLYTDMSRSAERFETLYHISQIIGAKLHLNEIYSAIHQAVTNLMETEYFCIALFDDATNTIKDVYAVNKGEPQVLTTRPVEKGLFANVLNTKKSVLFHSHEDHATEEIGSVLVGKLRPDEIPQSVIVVPLNIGTNAIGVLTTQSYQTHAYSRSDREILELLASNVAIAIENARLFEEVQYLAVTDPLTLLFNRRKFEEMAVREFKRARRYKRPLCVAMIDLDQFKHVNDTYGHIVGDQALVGVASLARNSLRNIDVLARYGGEEFIMLLPETRIHDAMATVERLRIDCQETDFQTSQGTISLTISIGLAELNPACETLEELVKRADLALYVSKQTGRNKTTVWETNLTNFPTENWHNPNQPEIP